MKKATKALSLFLVSILAVGLFAGCGSTGGDTAAGDGEKLRVALILPGRADDVSFNQAMYEGVMAVAAEYGDRMELKVVEEVYEVADIEPALMDFASEGYDVVFGHGFQFMEPIIKVAEKYPDTMFCLGTGYKTLANTCVYDVHLQDGGYLMGVTAALLSKTGKIGVIGGADASEIYRGHEAFKFGARSINPDIEIQEVYTGDWTDSAGAKEAAVSMYDSGVDIIWHSGDGIGLGVVEAAKEKNQMVLGNVADQSVLAPNSVVGGVVYEWKSVIRSMFEDVLNDNFTNRQDKFYWITAENGGLTYVPLTDVASQEVKDQVEESYRKLAAGEIEMPDFDADKTA
ncbi:MAG: BMP family protein [Christensenellaceae bacterium]|jgi:basic membrane protein A|nr:BMP family protein [Christensenellaceae bacterium]